jgi:hypothetical protein
MTVTQKTLEKIENLENKLWAVRPIWLLSGMITLVIGTASLVWGAVKYDNNKNKDIAAVSVKIDKLKESMDNRHFQDSLVDTYRWEDLYNAVSQLKDPEKKYAPSRIKGYKEIKKGNHIFTIPVYANNGSGN